jgi:hypothetical protein
MSQTVLIVLALALAAMAVFGLTRPARRPRR